MRERREREGREITVGDRQGSSDHVHDSSNSRQICRRVDAFAMGAIHTHFLIEGWLGHNMRGIL